MFWRRRATVETTRVGEYELRVEVLRRGTRSEGRVGRLFRDGVEIRGSQPGETVVPTTGDAAFVYLGDERPHLWSHSGWSLGER